MQLIQKKYTYTLYITYLILRCITYTHIFAYISHRIGASQVALVVKNPPVNARDVRDMGSNPRLGRSPGGGHGNPLQYSCMENPMDKRDWQAKVHGVTKMWTRLKWLSTHYCWKHTQETARTIDCLRRGPRAWWRFSLVCVRIFFLLIFLFICCIGS